MVNNAQQRGASPIFGTTNNSNSSSNNNNNNNRLNNSSNNNNSSFNQFNNVTTTNSNDMGRRLQRMVSAPVLQGQPKSCLRRKSCLHKSTADSVEVTDKNTDTEECQKDQKK